MRNPNGYGSVYKLSGKRRKPYAVRITTGWNDNGQPIYKFIGYFDNRKDAVMCLAKYNANPYDVYLQDSTIEKMWELFKERKLKGKEDTSRYKIYCSAYKNIKALHKVEIRKLKTFQIQEVIDNMTQGNSSKTQAHSLINQMFEIAMELDICNKNYAKFVEIKNAKKSTLHKPFTDEEIKKLWDNIFVCDIAPYALILIYTGMRAADLLSIKTENVHLDERYMIGGSKTAAGIDRIIPINEKIYPLICKLYDPSNAKLVKFKNYYTFKFQWDKDMEVLGFDHLPHDGRHTFASLMNSAEANITSVKKIMGHASSDITEGVYTHKHLKELVEAVNLI